MIYSFYFFTIGAQIANINLFIKINNANINIHITKWSDIHFSNVINNTTKIIISGIFTKIGSPILVPHTLHL